MIKSLEAWNFKKIEHTLMNFSEGLTALKGSNEAGKSSRYQAVAYALFGARALPLSLAETVTWGKPDSSLKVRLVFDYAGAEYTVQRSKSGAELFCKALNLLVSGQAEVTKYVENLFGVNADTASKLTVASQNELRGALEGKAAVPLIERLANISLIDSLIASAQERLPSGSTKALEAALQNCTAVIKPNADFSEIENIEQAAYLTWLDADTATKAETGVVKKLYAGFVELEKEIAGIYAHNNAITQAERDITQCAKEVDKPLPAFHDNILELEAKALAQLGLAPAVNALKVLNAFVPKDVGHYEGKDLTADLDKITEHVYDQGLLLAGLKADLRVAKIGRINDEQCGLCGKLLQDVPEVLAKNTEIDTKVAALQAQIELGEAVGKFNDHELLMLRGIAAENARVNNYFATVRGYVNLDDQVPPNATWGGAPVLTDTTDYRALIREARQKQTDYKVAEAQRETAKTRLTQAQEQLATLGAPRSMEHITDAKLELEAQRNLVASLQVKVAEKLATLTEIKRNLATAKAQHDAQVKAYEASVVQAESLRASIMEYDANNALIKRLREVRPIVAAHLWTVVLTAVSRYFSQIRGTQSVVTVANASFLIDGKPAEAYSGSTLDSLGLAIRMALSKTFLPNLDFLMLDEPAAGMDDEREAAMLGVLAASGYKQIIVVTHSTVCDSFCQSLIQV